ncbi:MAG: phosphate transport system regulatory protein PhoU, partial [Clostridiales bacterium]|nr:phosphate transport system regulatory protein PhoU [Clostridiales bacterium]
MNVRQQYDTELQQLSSELIRMGDQAGDAISLAMEALQRGDKTLARQIMDGDEHINAMEKDIEQRCLRLL